MFEISYSEKFFSGVAGYKKSGQQQALKKINALLQELAQHPTTGTGKPERLKGYDGEVYSRRIDQKNRLIYEIFEAEQRIDVISCHGHYDDK
ncbi:Txe/YoeB family addiction module toxin [Lonepinella sp. MS14437]|uniref:Txe/YoeB family addiction module toxin n=1 Tax=unclassified Lonepinella TaxID=2642006 RepID=UPI0036DCF2DE